MAKQQTWTAERVYDLLKQRFPSPAFVLLQQVRNATGFQKRERYADAVAVSVFPSRGVYLAGVEIKVSKSDWRKELADPDKASSIQKYCKYWYVAAPKDVVPVDEVPDGWGLLECSGNSIEATIAAKDNDPDPPDMLLLASILRNVSKSTISMHDHVAELESERLANEKAIADARELPGVKRELESLKTAIAEFEKSSGVRLDHPWRYDIIGTAVRDVLDGRTEAIMQKRNLVSVARRILKELDSEPGPESF